MFPEINKLFRKKPERSIKHLHIDHSDLNILAINNIDHTKLDKTNMNKYIVHKEEDICKIFGTWLEKSHNITVPNNSKFHKNIRKKIRYFKLLDKEKKRNNATLFTFNSTNTSSNTLNNSYFTDFNELYLKFKNLKNETSAGIDGVPNVVLKNLSVNVIEKYVILFNNALNYSYFPKIWKVAKVVMLKKPGKDYTNPNNYRPISLLPNISKVYETIINDKITKIVIESQLLPENQFGFRHKHSTVHAINKLTSDICWYINKKKGVGACLIDLEKAFNSVWIDGLIYKLLNYRFPNHLVRLIMDMILDNKFIIANNSNIKNEYVIKSGLQQGTVNSPILFSIYLTELLELLKTFKGSNFSIAFADDLIIYAAGNNVEQITSNVQKQFNLIIDYCKIWLLKINTDKCEAILFRNTVDKTSNNIKKFWKNFQIKAFNSTIIHNKKSVKYLGVVLNHHLNYIDNVKRNLEKGTKAFMASKKLFYNKTINERVKILAYQTLIRPVISYAGPIWFNISASLMEKIRKFERKCIRACVNLHRKPETDYKHFYSNKCLYRKANIVRFDNFLVKLIRNHFDRSLKTPENGLISHIYYHNEEYIKNSMKTGFVAPEHFIYLDAKGYIQNHEHVPLLYHYNRRATCKCIEYNPLDIEIHLLKYDMFIPERDKKIIRNHYWWLNE